MFCFLLDRTTLIFQDDKGIINILNIAYDNHGRFTNATLRGNDCKEMLNFTFKITDKVCI